MRRFPTEVLVARDHAREGEAIPVNMFPLSLLNKFVTREHEALAEPLRCWLGRSLALPKPG